MDEKNNEFELHEANTIGTEPSPSERATGAEGTERELTLFEEASERMKLEEEAAEKKRSRTAVLTGVICCLSGILLGILITILVFVIQIGSLPKFRVLKMSGSKEVALLSELLDYIKNQHYGETPDSEVLANAAAHAMVNAIGDRYAAYFSEEEYAEYTSSMNGNYKGGVGISVYAPDENGALIHRVFEGTFADEAGLKGGDIILALDGVSVKGMTMDEMTDLIGGDAGTTVDFTVLRGDEELTFTVMRGDVYVKRIEYMMLDNGIGYIHIVSFTGDAKNEFNAALEALQAQGADSLVVDLRDNPGVSLSMVIDMCDVMLPECTIASMQGKTTNPTQYFYSDADMCPLPFVVLVNGDSASASEIFAGAMQDNKRAAIIGTQTYGKGIVQTTFHLDDGHGYLKMTTDAYYTPNGTSLSGTGITPDVVVELPEELMNYDVYTLYTEHLSEDTQLLAAVEYLLNGN